METTFPRSLYNTVAATTCAIAILVISATLASSYNLVGAHDNSDDRGSGRVSQGDRPSDLILRPNGLAIRGSGRVGSDPDQPSTQLRQERSHHFTWRGSGRVDENPNLSNSSAALPA